MLFSVRKAAVAVLCLLCACSVFSCSGGSGVEIAQSPVGQAGPGLVPEASNGGGLAGLPVDILQPREEVDSNGYVIPDRTVAGINQDSEFAPGTEYQAAGSGVSEVGEAALLASDLAPDGLSWATWRLQMGGQEPGVVSADVNLLPTGGGGRSEYYLAVANYGDDRWDWHGPFDDSHVRISVAGDIADGASYLSGLGNTFVAVVADAGSNVQVVGTGANPLDTMDTTAPPAPTGLSAVAAVDGVELQWNDVIAADLAGYAIYWSDGPFSSPDDPGVDGLPYLQGGTRAYLPANKVGDGDGGPKEIRITAVDAAGNESPVSTEVTFDFPNPSAPPANVVLEASYPSGMVNDPISLTATGGTAYDWDLDGDGVYEYTGDMLGMQLADTSRTGVIRPAVRATDSGGVCVGCGAVSLIVTGNSRPCARAYASPASGAAPLSVTFTGEGWDGDGTVVYYDWDFDGDGTWDYSSPDNPNPSAQEFTRAGMYNAKFRVEDDQGAFDVDTVSVYAETGGGGNTPPTAVLALGTGEEAGNTPHTVHFDFSGSSDAEGPIAQFWLDVEGDGTYDVMTAGNTYDHIYYDAGAYLPRLMVIDGEGDSDTDQLAVNVNGPPTARCVSNRYTVGIHETFTLDASGSTDPENDISGYEFDFDGDDVYEFMESSPYYSWYYSYPGVYEIGVAVFDGDMAYGYTTVTVTVTGWRGEVAASDPTDYIGMYCDLEVVNGHPAGSYTNITDNTIEYVRCTDPDGINPWPAPVVVDSLGATPQVTKLFLVENNPAVVYYDLANTSIKYCRATDMDGTAWGTPVTISYLGGVGDIGLYLDVDIIEGKPAIACTADNGDRDLAFVQANDMYGNTWGSVVIVEGGAGDQGLDPSLHVIGGVPAISYNDASGAGVLKFVTAADSSGMTWNAPVTVDAAGVTGQLTNLLLVEGRPAIVYFDGADGSVNLAVADDFDGTAWSTFVTVSDIVAPKMGVAAEYVNGLLYASWIDGSDNSLYYTHALDTAGQDWSRPVVLAGPVNYYWSTSINDVNGWVGVLANNDDDNYVDYYQLY